MKLPDLSDTEWKYVFIQSTSRIRILSKDSHFMYCKCIQNNSYNARAWIQYRITVTCTGNIVVGERHKNEQKASERLTATDESLKLVDEKYKKLIRVPDDQEYPILDFTNLKSVSEVLPSKKYHPSLGYGFYEFTKPEYISRNKQVILMDKVYHYIYLY